VFAKLKVTQPSSKTQLRPRDGNAACSFLCAVFYLLPARMSARVCRGAAGPGPELPNTTRLLRFPTTNGRQIVFVTQANFTTVAKEGGIARRITSGPVTLPSHGSPPTEPQLAFTSQYDGNTEVYVMPAEGGAPKRLTTSATLRPRRYLRPDGAKQSRYGLGKYQAPGRLPFPNEIVQRFHWRALHRRAQRGITHSNFQCRAAVSFLFRPTIRKWRLIGFSANPHLEALPRCMADDIWIYDFKNGTTENLTNNPAQDICPMWGPDDRIYFTSDRDGRMNLFATDLTSKETKLTSKSLKS